MSIAYLDLADFLAISEAVLRASAEDIARLSRLELAESALHAPAASFGGFEFYPDIATKAAVLCTRISRIMRCPTATNGRIRVHDRVLSAQWPKVDPAARR